MKNPTANFLKSLKDPKNHPNNKSIQNCNSWIPKNLKDPKKSHQKTNRMKKNPTANLKDP